MPSGGVQQLVLASGLWPSIDAIGQTPVSVRPDGVVRVQDIGTVFPGTPDRTGLVTANGREAATISVSQQVGANILDIEAGVREAVDELAGALPAGPARSRSSTTWPSSSATRSPTSATRS